MSSDELVHSTELFFRTYVHATLPLHAALVALMCNRPRPPLELATVLEDIGQAYIRLADDLNAALVQRGMLNLEPSAEDPNEARIDDFVRSLLASCGSLRLNNGDVVNGQQAIEAFPIVADAVRTAVLLKVDRPER